MRETLSSGSAGEGFAFPTLRSCALGLYRLAKGEGAPERDQVELRVGPLRHHDLYLDQPLRSVNHAQT